MREMPECCMMRPITLVTLLAAALCAGCSASSSYEGSSSGQTPGDCFALTLQEQMPGVLASNGVPGAVVSYIKNGEVAWTRAFGVANLQTGTPMRPDMVFNHDSSRGASVNQAIGKLWAQACLYTDTGREQR